MNRLSAAEMVTILEPALTKQTQSVDSRVSEACEYMKSKVHIPLKLNDVAAHVFLSPGHLSWLFRQTYGCTPVAYLRRYRMQLAKQLLMNTDLSINAISSKVGYADQSQFSRAFHREIGTYPLAFRTAHRCEEAMVSHRSSVMAAPRL